MICKARQFDFSGNAKDSIAYNTNKNIEGAYTLHKACLNITDYSKVVLNLIIYCAL
jgi:hypothetical protein